MSECVACTLPEIEEPALPETEDGKNEALAKMAKALGHPARVTIIRHLIANPSCVCGDIVDVLPLAQSTVSQHLKMLKEVGLLTGEINGKNVCYCVNMTAFIQFKTLLADI